MPWVHEHLYVMMLEQLPCCPRVERLISNDKWRLPLGQTSETTQWDKDKKEDIPCDCTEYLSHENCWPKHII